MTVAGRTSMRRATGTRTFGRIALSYRGMVVLRADPWMPDYGMGFEVAADEPSGSVDPFVETEDWTKGRSGAQRAGALVFVDGVRRVELRVVASHGARRAAGLFGS